MLLRLKLEMVSEVMSFVLFMVLVSRVGFHFLN